MSKMWSIKTLDEEKVNKYESEFKVSHMLAKMLVAKEIQKENVLEFLEPSIEKLNDPFLMPDMQKLVDRVLIAKERNENIVIYGDYDVDGITSITVLYSFLKDIGVTPSYYLPDRLEEGYGLNKEALKNLKEKGFDLVITVDCGISAHEEANFAKELDLDLIITDHHECGESLPEAIAVVNPKRPDSEYPCSTLAGVGVTFKVITALSQALGLDKDSYLKYIDIVAVGTIADIVPLLSENRIITFNGLNALKNTKNEGLKALIKVAGIEKITSDAVSFGLAPRINACGRMNDATVAVKLLLSESEMEAVTYAKVLDEQNRQRQDVEKNIFAEAVEIITKNELDKRKSIVLAKERLASGGHWNCCIKAYRNVYEACRFACNRWRFN